MAGGEKNFKVKQFVNNPEELCDTTLCAGVVLGGQDFKSHYTIPMGIYFTTPFFAVFFFYRNQTSITLEGPHVKNTTRDQWRPR